MHSQPFPSLLAFTRSATAVEPQSNPRLKAKLPERTDVKDRDLDGVPDEKDNCPSIPNKPMKNGKQSLAPIRRPLLVMSSWDRGRSGHLNQ